MKQYNRTDVEFLAKRGKDYIEKPIQTARTILRSAPIDQIVAKEEQEREEQDIQNDYDVTQTGQLKGKDKALKRKGDTLTIVLKQVLNEDRVPLYPPQPIEEIIQNKSKFEFSNFEIKRAVLDDELKKDAKSKKHLLDEHHLKNLSEIQRKFAIYKHNKIEKQITGSKFVFLDNRQTIRDYNKEKIRQMNILRNPD